MVTEGKGMKQEKKEWQKEFEKEFGLDPDWEKDTIIFDGNVLRKFIEHLLERKKRQK